MKRFLITVFFVTFFQQSSFCQAVSEFGKSIEEVQMSILSTNDIIKIDSTNQNYVQCIVANNSTNFVYFFAGWRLNFQLYLIDEFGKATQLTKDVSGEPGGGPTVGVDAHERQVYAVNLPLGKQIKPGNYKLKAEMTMYITDHPRKGDDPGIKSFTVGSNLITLTLK